LKASTEIRDASTWGGLGVPKCHGDCQRRVGRAWVRPRSGQHCPDPRASVVGWGPV